MKTSLRTIASAFGVPLPKSGDITGSALDGNYCLIAFCGASWRRRAVQSVRMFPRRGKKADVSAATDFARSLASRVGLPVTLEHGRMMMDIMPDGSIANHAIRLVVKPHQPLP